MAINSQPSLLPDYDAVSTVVDVRPTNLGETVVTYAPAREILTRATGFMNPYDFTLNPYSGCSFGCTYCYAAFFSRNVKKTRFVGRLGQREGECRRADGQAQARFP